MTSYETNPQQVQPHDSINPRMPQPAVDIQMHF